MRKKGFGTALLEALIEHSKRTYPTKYIGAEVHPQNLGAIALLKRFNFYRDAKIDPLRPHTLFEKPQDLYRYSPFPAA